MTERDSLTGVWHGLYSYPRYLEPVYFVATLISHGLQFSGSTHEAAQGHAGAPLQLFAFVEGQADATSVSFAKQYDGTGGWWHKVGYEGTLSSDRMEIDGHWVIGGNWSGRFLMIRSPGATEAIARKAFARV